MTEDPGESLTKWAMEEVMSYLFRAIDDGKSRCINCGRDLWMHSYNSANECFERLEERHNARD